MTGTPQPTCAHVYEHQVASEDCVARGGFEVLSTPSVVRLMEVAAMEALQQQLADGEESVGTTVAISHLLPTLAGQTVTVSARELPGNGAQRRFEVTVSEGGEVVANGHHDRFIVNSKRFARRLSARADTLKRDDETVPLGT